MVIRFARLWPCRLAALLIVGSLIPAAAQAQDMMPVGVQPDRIKIGPEFVPRCQTLPATLVVPAGKTIEAASDSTWDCIEVAGTLRVARTHDTVLRFTHLLVLPGGTLDVGTQADPIPADRRVELIVRDVPIDTTRDPFQWGNGLLNFGRQDRCGAQKLAWTTLTAEVKAGATTLTLAEDPQGWRVGDELLVPDTAYAKAPQREPRLTIASLSGRTVTLAGPLTFDHLAPRDPAGAIVLLPRVANLTRNVSIRSENPNGTRGHTADIGHHASWQTCANEFSGLGRTRAERLDNTTAEPAHVGTNQVGRYTDHHHHAHGLGSSSIDNVYRGSRPIGGKWGLVAHGTHDALFESNIAIDFTGSGFVTEDGYEVRNVFRKNFAAYIINPDSSRCGASEVAASNIKDLNAPGIECVGFWLRGIMNSFEGNEAWNNGTGINVFNFQQVPGSYPSRPGGEMDTPLKQPTAKPVVFKGNVTASNFATGLEFWGLSKFPYEDHVSVYNGYAQFFMVNSEPTQLYLKNPTAVSRDGASICLKTSNGYVQQLDLEGGRLVGCATGISDGGAIDYVRVTGTTFQNVVDFDYRRPARVTEHVDVKHIPLPGHPAQYIIFGEGGVWKGGPLPNVGTNYMFQRGGRSHIIRNWQGTGKDYRLYEPQQLASTMAWPSDSGQHVYNCPEAGLTVGQCWDKFGMAWGGQVVSDAEAVHLEGVTNGIARDGAGLAFGPPRGVITFPTSRKGAEVKLDDNKKPYIMLYGLATGDPAAASQDVMISVDGGGSNKMVPSIPNFRPDLRQWSSRAVAEGQHEVRTWRVTASGAKIPGSEMVFHYVVGAVEELPRQPPAPKR